MTGKILLHINCSGNAITDKSIYNRNLTITGNYEINNDSAYIPHGTWISVQDSDDFKTYKKDFEAEVVFYKIHSNNWGRVIEMGDYRVDNCWHWSFDGSGNKLGIQMGKNGGGGARIESDSAIPVNQWTKFTFRRINNVGYMFVNGIQQSNTLDLTNESFESNKFYLFHANDSASNTVNCYLKSVKFRLL